MRLFYSPFHTFIHKVLVTIHETGLWDDVTFVPTYPFKNRNGEDQGDKYSLAELNPLDKVPTLALDDGQVIYASQAIVEYFDTHSRSGKHLYPPAGSARWDALTRLALGDTIFETTVMLVMEGWHPEKEQRLDFFRWIWPKIFRGLDQLEAHCKRGPKGFDIGHASMLHAISYMEFRGKFYDAKDPLHPTYDWADDHPNLKAWWEENIQRPSVTCHYNKDFEGDDSVAFFRANVDAIIAAQQESDH